MITIEGGPMATTQPTTIVQGTVESGFEPVRDAFERNFAERGEQGAACAVYVRGTKVVDLWGGVADHTTGRPWTKDTISLVWSATKGPAAMCVHLLAQRGEIDLDLPVAHYWPEFAQNGKQDITVRMVLTHQAGLPVVDAPLTMDELLAVTPAIAALERQRPVWEPGTKHGYHGITYGFLVTEIVSRVTGRRVGPFLAEEIAAPLDLDFWIGLPAEHEHRVTRLIEATPTDTSAVAAMPADIRSAAAELAEAVVDPSSLTYRALHVGGFETGDMNDPRVHATEWAYGNGISDARSLARVYAACVGEVDGVRILSEDQLAAAMAEQADGPDAVLKYPARWSSGFMLPNRVESWLGEGSFGFTGAGGHIGLGHVGEQVGFAYTMTKMFGNLTGDPRPAATLEALKRCL
jgi:CubicO group peptidase (beta-lactamase class C family)